MGQAYDVHDAIAFHHPNGLSKGNVCGEKNDSQIRRDKGHSILFTAGEVGQKLSMTWKTVPTEEERALINRSSGNSVNTSSRA